MKTGSCLRQILQKFSKNLRAILNWKGNHFHPNIIPGLRNTDFTAENKNRTIFSIRQLTRAQRYILKELRSLNSTSKDTGIISSLDQAFSLPLTEVIKKDINHLHRKKITGDELLNELKRLYQRYNMADLEKHQHQSDEQSESSTRVICSAAFV